MQPITLVDCMPNFATVRTLRFIKGLAASSRSLSIVSLNSHYNRLCVIGFSTKLFLLLYNEREYIVDVRLWTRNENLITSKGETVI